MKQRLIHLMLTLALVGSISVNQTSFASEPSTGSSRASSVKLSKLRPISPPTPRAASPLTLPLEPVSAPAEPSELRPRPMSELLKPSVLASEASTTSPSTATQTATTEVDELADAPSLAPSQPNSAVQVINLQPATSVRRPLSEMSSTGLVSRLSEVPEPAASPRSFRRPERASDCDIAYVPALPSSGTPNAPNIDPLRLRQFMQQQLSDFSILAPQFAASPSLRSLRAQLDAGGLLTADQLLQAAVELAPSVVHSEVREFFCTTLLPAGELLPFSAGLASDFYLMLAKVHLQLNHRLLALDAALLSLSSAQKISQYLAYLDVAKLIDDNAALEVGFLQLANFQASRGRRLDALQTLEAGLERLAHSQLLRQRADAIRQTSENRPL